jgi:RNA polymerase II subunit A-like phosphatase
MLIHLRRPGLTRFMSKLSKLYEMHVYTMGTRSYANAVCAALDPTGAWFGSRVLTRSESGSQYTRLCLNYISQHCR